MRAYSWAVVPVGKPRQTQRDKWAQRPAVMRYRAFADEVRRLAKEQGFAMPESGARIVFSIPMPKSWSEAKRARMRGQPHRQKPDLDNLVKAFTDALCEDDCAIWNVSAEKRWSDAPAIDVTLTPLGAA